MISISDFGRDDAHIEHRTERLAARDHARIIAMLRKRCQRLCHGVRAVDRRREPLSPPPPQLLQHDRVNPRHARNKPSDGRSPRNEVRSRSKNLASNITHHTVEHAMPEARQPATNIRSVFVRQRGVALPALGERDIGLTFAKSELALGLAR